MSSRAVRQLDSHGVVFRAWQLEGALAAFCDRWVPSGADAEKYAILRQISELGGGSGDLAR